jgi:adenosylcobinamide-phosphate synthase
MAGALGVQLGGRNYYHGVPQDRPLIGDGARCLTTEHIAKARDITVVAWGLGLFFALLSLWQS